MEIRFRTGQNHRLDDLISSTEKNVDIVGWSSDDDVIIRDWKFIDYKRSPSQVKQNSTNKWVHLNGITFVDCTFIDVNFIGGVPMDRCTFKNCIFENCMLTDHIRWNNFSKCTFSSCIFAGYFHGSKFAPSCKFKKVLLSCYGDIYATLQKGVKCTKTEKLDLLRYFYPNESSVFDTYKVGMPYFVKKFIDSFFKNEMDKYETHVIDGKNYFKDTVKKIDFNLDHYEPQIRIVGKYAPLANECRPC